MLYNIKPLVGVNEIKFGQSRIEVIERIGKPEHSFKSKDSYFESILQIHYNREGLVEFIVNIKEFIQKLFEYGFKSNSLYNYFSTAFWTKLLITS